MSSTNTYKPYCVYITHYSGDLLPQNYIGSSTVNKINNGYYGSVRSKKYRSIWESELKNHPELFSIEIISTHDTRPEATYKELQLQRMFNVVKSNLFVNLSYAAPNGYFGMDTSGENNGNFGNKGSCLGLMAINNGRIMKFIPKNDPIPEGWVKGKRDRDKIGNKKGSCLGLMSITDGQVNKFISKNDLIPEGWVKGKTQKKHKPKTNFVCIITTKKNYNKSNAARYFPDLIKYF